MKKMDALKSIDYFMRGKNEKEKRFNFKGLSQIKSLELFN